MGPVSGPVGPIGDDSWGDDFAVPDPTHSGAKVDSQRREVTVDVAEFGGSVVLGEDVVEVVPALARREPRADPTLFGPIQLTSAMS